MRANLSPAQEAAAIARRKAIYEELHPETRAEAFRGNRYTGSLANENSAFTSDAAGKTGKSRRSVEVAAARGETLANDLEAIAGTSIDKGVEMDVLAKMPVSERAGVIAHAAGLLNVSERTVKSARAVQREGWPKLVAVERGEVSASAAKVAPGGIRMTS